MKEETIQKILQFRDDRDWKQYHTPKDLAISISLEASELLEIFQWSGSDTKQEKIEEELADVLIYCAMMADICHLDMDDIIAKKLVRNAQKYPVEQAKGKKEKYTEL